MHLISFIVFVFGLVLGSFLNVCIWRLPRDLSIVRPRSFCPACSHTIAWHDNIPVFSYLWLGRKCRHCKAPISPRYAVVEILTAVLLTAVTLCFWGRWGWMMIGWALAAALVVCAFIDLEHFVIPDIITLPGIALGLLVHTAFPGLSAHQGHWTALGWSALGGIVGGGSLLCVAVVGRFLYGKEVMGMGDVKLMAMVGTFLGWANALLGIFFGSLTGSAVGISLVISKKSNWQSRIPFGPYLAMGSILALLAGKPLIQWYVNLLIGPQPYH